jgi:hypothetical protein
VFAVFCTLISVTVFLGSVASWFKSAYLDIQPLVQCDFGTLGYLIHQIAQTLESNIEQSRPVS